MSSESPIRSVYLVYAFSKAFPLGLALALKSYLHRARYRYSRKLYFRFLPNWARHRLPNFLPRDSSTLDPSWEIKERLVINLIRLGKFNSTQIAASLIDRNVQGITSRVVEEVFRENRSQFQNLPETYLDDFAVTHSDNDTDP